MPRENLLVHHHTHVAPSSTVLLLARHADAAWRCAIRPWLEAAAGRVERSYVIVATRGQAHGLKQRCLTDGLPLLGVEFLTPGLARRKWAATDPTDKPAIARELLLLQLQTIVTRRLNRTEGERRGNADRAACDRAWGFWQSLQSDPERALDDLEELLRAGLGPADFAIPPLRDVFSELVAWAGTHGFDFAAVRAARAARGGVDVPRRTGRVLVYGLSAELAGEFCSVAAFIRRCAAITAVLPEPEFFGGMEQDERWIELWSSFLGVEPIPLDAEPPEVSCEAVAEVWREHRTGAVAARVLVAPTRQQEMRRVANEIGALLAGGAENIGVVFPRSDAAHLELVRLLEDRAIPFADLLETAGPPPAEVQAQHALLAFFRAGNRLEEFVALWPWLRVLGVVKLSLAAVRRACERSFDHRQTHALGPHLAGWAEGNAAELARVAQALGEPWPEELALADALTSFHRACAALGVEPPEGWGAVEALAAIDSEPKPRAVVAATLDALLAAKTAATNAAGRGGFARVTLTTRRRAEALAWSHLIFVESNAGVWPERREASCWLTDEHRAALQARPPHPIGLFTTEQRAALERAGYARLARDTERELIFSAALFADDDPEVKRAPNSWVERIMLVNELVRDGNLERAFTSAARAAARRAAPEPALAGWRAIWRRRRDPAAPFDEFFFAGDPARITPEALPARLIERGVQDPAELWFEAVLRTRRVGWMPFVRARRKALGQLAHALLARVLTPSSAVRGFGAMPAAPEARERMAAALSARRADWPPNRYWDSFHAELAHVCWALLNNLYTITAGPYVATEAWLPTEAHLELGARRIPVHGRLDLVRLDQPAWAGAHVDIIDFKTGADAELSAGRMARSGASLQLGVYLAAARSLGIRGGRVWMVKPEPGAVTDLSFSDMGLALTKLRWLEQALDRGVYGALTRDRSDYAPAGCDWPLACTPVPHAVLARKFAVTFELRPEDAVDE